MERSRNLARRSEQLAIEADANDGQLDQLIIQSGYTIDEVRDAMLARWGDQ